MHSWKESSEIHFNSVVTAFLMASISGKRTPLVTPLSLGNRKNHKEPGQVSREDDLARWRFSRPGTDGCSGHCELGRCLGEAAMRCPATTRASSRALNEASAAGSLYRHAGWLSDPVARTPCGRFLSHRRTRSAWAWFWNSTVLLSLASATTDTFTEGSGAWSPSHTRRSKTHHQWWLSAASLAQFGDARECPDIPPRAAPSGHRPEASAPSSHRSSAYPKSSVIIFHTLSRLISSSSSIIWTVNRQLPCTICFTRSTLSIVLLVEGLPLLESSSTSSRPSLNCLCHSKTRERDIVSSRTLSAAFRVHPMEFVPAGPKTSDWYVALLSWLDEWNLSSR